MAIKSFPVYLFIMMLAAFFCGLIFILDGNYYFAAWNTSVDAKGCTAVHTDYDGVPDASRKTELSITNLILTKTITDYTDTACKAVSGTIVAKSSFVIGNYLDALIIYFDSSKNKYNLWMNQPVSALAIELKYDTATLVCKTDVCVTYYSGIISLNNCSSGTLAINQSYDYTTCEFSGQPATLYTLCYKNSFGELIFGTSHAPSTDSVTTYAGDSEANRHKYLYANDRYVLK